MASMKIKPYLIIGGIFFLSSIDFAVADLRGVCRVATEVALNPFIPFELALERFAMARTPSTWDGQLYAKYYEALASGTRRSRLHAEGSRPIRMEEILAEVDFRLSARLFPLLNGASVADAPSALRFRLEQSMRVLHRPSRNIEPEDIRHILHAYYALSRRVPIDRVEIFLHPFSDAFADGLEFRAQEAILSRTLNEVFSDFGFTAVEAPTRRRVRENLKTAMRAIGSATGFDSDPGFSRVFSADSFYDRVTQIGYPRAIEEFRSQIAREIGTSLEVDLALRMFGVAVATVFTVELGAKMLGPQLGILDEDEMREAIIESWRVARENELQRTLPVSDPELVKVRAHVQELAPDALRQAYRRATSAQR